MVNFPSTWLPRYEAKTASAPTPTKLSTWVWTASTEKESDKQWIVRSLSRYFRGSVIDAELTARQHIGRQTKRSTKMTSRLWWDQLKCLDERASLDGNVTWSGDVETLERQGKRQLLTTRHVSWNDVFFKGEFHRDMNNEKNSGQALTPHSTSCVLEFRFKQVRIPIHGKSGQCWSSQASLTVIPHKELIAGTADSAHDNDRGTAINVLVAGQFDTQQRTIGIRSWWGRDEQRTNQHEVWNVHGSLFPPPAATVSNLSNATGRRSRKHSFGTRTEKKRKHKPKTHWLKTTRVLQRELSRPRMLPFKSAMTDMTNVISLESTSILSRHRKRRSQTCACRTRWKQEHHIQKREQKKKVILSVQDGHRPRDRDERLTRRGRDIANRWQRPGPNRWPTTWSATFLVDFWCVHRLQLLHVCNHYVTLLNSPRVQSVSKEQSR